MDEKNASDDEKKRRLCRSKATQNIVLDAFFSNNEKKRVVVVVVVVVVVDGKSKRSTYAQISVVHRVSIFWSAEGVGQLSQNGMGFKRPRFVHTWTRAFGPSRVQTHAHV